ncbi:hypothetical protein PanWU01x14_155830 [Parasponia andersonii]|uniref:Uncharacterized protein n=1 Tax=Parasponia andersonii TaxID=3476 RepID=A0A2P5CG96_PARAD|nr:hypothetical protein PanWU01x14_155830 [Parasponia andersonii]
MNMKELAYLCKVAEDAHNTTHAEFAKRQLSAEEKLAHLTAVVSTLFAKIDKLSEQFLPTVVRKSLVNASTITATIISAPAIAPVVPLSEQAYHFVAPQGRYMAQPQQHQLPTLGSDACLFDLLSNLTVGLVFHVREFFEKHGVQTHFVLQKKWNKSQVSSSCLFIKTSC